MHRLVLSAARARPLSRCTASRSTFLISRYASSRSSPPQTPNNDANERSAEGSSSGSGSTPPELDNIGIPPTNFSKPTLHALNFWYRFAKFSLIGLASVAGGTALAFKGVHYWIEHVELAAPSDPDGELARWGWVKEMERWTGGERGGTDAGLGTKIRYALRSAWSTQHWGAGAQILSANAVARAKQSRDRAVEARLEFSHDFLTLALALADEQQQGGKKGEAVRPETGREILVRKAATLERIGSRGALYDARASYERVWDEQLKQGAESDVEDCARLALKLGDVNARLGDADEARSWWARSLRLASSNDSSALFSRSDEKDNTRLELELPDRLPSSPHAQRTVAAVLSSLSAYYAQLGQLSDARAVQDTGITLLAPSLPSSSQVPESSTSELLANHQTDKSNSNGKANSNSGDAASSGEKKSLPQALHELFLQHRLSLLALHRAEVNHALRPPSSSSSSQQTLEELAQAAIEAESVVFALTSSSASSSPDSNSNSDSSEPPAYKAGLDQTYDKQKVLKGPASGLLRDARRTAVHAWTLSGILHENAASSSSSSISQSSYNDPTSTSATLTRKLFSFTLPASSSTPHSEIERRNWERLAALRCYNRALMWTGVTLDGTETKEMEPVPSREMLESEWRVLWEGYSRTREIVFESVLREQEQERDKAEREAKKD